MTLMVRGFPPYCRRYFRYFLADPQLYAKRRMREVGDGYAVIQDLCDFRSAKLSRINRLQRVHLINKGIVVSVPSALARKPITLIMPHAGTGFMESI
jgi:hypothetical protein